MGREHGPSRRPRGARGTPAHSARRGRDAMGVAARARLTRGGEETASPPERPRLSTTRAPASWAVLVASALGRLHVAFANDLRRRPDAESPCKLRALEVGDPGL